MKTVLVHLILFLRANNFPLPYLHSKPTSKWSSPKVTTFVNDCTVKLSSIEGVLHKPLLSLNQLFQSNFDCLVNDLLWFIFLVQNKPWSIDSGMTQPGGFQMALGCFRPPTFCSKTQSTLGTSASVIICALTSVSWYLVTHCRCGSEFKPHMKFICVSTNSQLSFLNNSLITRFWKLISIPFVNY